MKFTLVITHQFVSISIVCPEKRQDMRTLLSEILERDLLVAHGHNQWY